MMSRIVIISNDKHLRSELQKEVNSFSDEVQISSVISHLSKKYGCNAEIGYPRVKDGKRYVYCYFDEN